MPKKESSTKKKTVSKKTARVESSPGLLILQWLTYALWGLLGLSLILLVKLVFNYYLTKAWTFSAEEIFYPTASVIVFLIIAICCDIAYSKHEPKAKSGVASAITVIHTVLFSISAIVAVSVAVFAGIGMLTSYGQNATEHQSVLLTALVISLFATALTLRVTPLKMFSASRLISRAVLILIPVAVLVAAFVGPVNREFQAKQDRLIDQSLAGVNTGINAYVSKYNKLPASLNDIDVSYDPSATEVLKQNLIEYKPITETEGTDQKQHRYQLCTDYQFEKKSDFPDFAPVAPKHPDSNDDADYTMYVSNSRHDAGKVCYKLFSQYEAEINTVK